MKNQIPIPSLGRLIQGEYSELLPSWETRSHRHPCLVGGAWRGADMIYPIPFALYSYVLVEDLRQPPRSLSQGCFMLACYILQCAVRAMLDFVSVR